MIENRRRRAAGRGFTLIEILIAFAILAVALVTLLDAFSAGLRATATAERSTAAVLLARSILDRVGSEIPVQDGAQSGRAEDGTEWSIRMRQLEAMGATSQQDNLFIPYEVAVTVAVPRQPPIILTTLRLAPQRPAGEIDEFEADSPQEIDEQP